MSQSVPKHGNCKTELQGVGTLPEIILRVGFTGTRLGMSNKQKQTLVDLLEQLHNRGARYFHHGDCVGADAEAHDIAVSVGFEIVGHPPIIEDLRAFKRCDYMRTERPYILRNHDIVDEVDYMIAAPYSDKEVRRSGTWATVRYAKDTGKKGIVLGRR